MHASLAAANWGGDALLTHGHYHVSGEVAGGGGGRKVFARTERSHQTLIWKQVGGRDLARARGASCALVQSPFPLWIHVVGRREREGLIGIHVIPKVMDGSCCRRSSSSSSDANNGGVVVLY